MKRISLLLFMVLFSTSAVWAQKEATTQNKSHEVENTYSVSFVAREVFIPSLMGEGEWKINPDWVLGANLSAGSPVIDLVGEGSAFVVAPQVFTRWYFNRDQRFAKNKITRKNSGFFFESGVGYAYYHSRYKPHYSENNETYTETLNTLYGYLGTGYKLVAKNNIYFGAKIGIGYGLNFDFAPNSGIEAAILPLLDLTVGYSF